MLSRIRVFRNIYQASVARGLTGSGVSVRSAPTVFSQRWLQSQPTRKSSIEEMRNQKNKNALMWTLATIVTFIGLSYASVPLYKMFCQVTGIGGSVQGTAKFTTATAETEILEDADPISVTFNSDVSSSLNWRFKPLQTRVYIRPGETTLAFYEAENRTDQRITGVATYNVQPPRAGIYFNKIQCFCFEEQQLRPNEKIEMPVFFFIDPEFAHDPYMKNIKEIVLSYTFFRTEDVDIDVAQQNRLLAEQRAS